MDLEDPKPILFIGFSNQHLPEYSSVQQEKNPKVRIKAARTLPNQMVCLPSSFLPLITWIWTLSVIYLKAIITFCFINKYLYITFSLFAENVIWLKIVIWMVWKSQKKIKIYITGTVPLVKIHIYIYRQNLFSGCYNLHPGNISFDIIKWHPYIFIYSLFKFDTKYYISGGIRSKRFVGEY